MAMNVISDCAITAVVNAPLEMINLTEWLFTLKEHEYQACSVAHLAAGATLGKDGKRMSLNVELVGGSLLVQHYVEDISAKDHCRVSSKTDSISPMGNTKLGVIWELKVKKLSDKMSELSNRVVVLFTEEFRDLLKRANIADLEAVRIGMSENVKAHNAEETPLFAKDIERKALNGIWN
jgi:hypothetical protein